MKQTKKVVAQVSGGEQSSTTTDGPTFTVEDLVVKQNPLKHQRF